MEILNKVLEVIDTKGVKVYLVGGAVRDWLLGGKVSDVDMVVMNLKDEKDQVQKLAREVAADCGGTLVALDPDREIYRIVMGGQDNFSLDFCGLKGQTLEQDLLARDFTVNAMALPLEKETLAILNHPERLIAKLIDPWQGLDDLKKGMLRVLKQTSIEDDPLRILRAIRLGSSYSWSLTEETIKSIKAKGYLVTKPAKERTGEEFFKLLKKQNIAPWIEVMVEQLNFLQYLWPEIDKLKSTKQNFHHSVNAWTHCYYALAAMEELLNQPEHFPEDLRPLVLEKAQEPLVKGKSTRKEIWKFTALFHDVGKIITSGIKPDGRITFYGHELAGKPLIREMGRKLAFSSRELSLAEKLVGGHMRPLQLSAVKNLSRKAIYRLFRDFGEETVDILVLSLADYTAKAKIKGEDQELVNYKDFICHLLRMYLFNRKDYLPDPLLTGQDICQQFPQMQGNRIGYWLKKIEGLQVSGELNSKEDALEYLRSKV